MTTEPNPPLDLEALFEEFEDEHSDFGCVDKPLATRDDILTLVRCGVRLDGDLLAMFI